MPYYRLTCLRAGKTVTLGLYGTKEHAINVMNRENIHPQVRMCSLSALPAPIITTSTTNDEEITHVVYPHAGTTHIYKITQTQ